MFSGSDITLGRLGAPTSLARGAPLHAPRTAPKRCPFVAPVHVPPSPSNTTDSHIFRRRASRSVERHALTHSGASLLSGVGGTETLLSSVTMLSPSLCNRL